MSQRGEGGVGLVRECMVSEVEFKLQCSVNIDILHPYVKEKQLMECSSTCSATTILGSLYLL